MIEMGYEENDPAMIPEIQEMLDEFVKELEELRTKTLLSGEYDGCNAILKLNAGAGWYRGDGLVQYAVSYVPALGGQKGLYDRGA